MTARRPLVLVGGVPSELPITDALAGVIDDTSTASTVAWSAQKTGAAIAAIAGMQGAGSALNGVVSGCGVLYRGTLSFEMGAGSFYIDGTLYSAIGQTLSLNAANATNARIDVLYVDSAGAFGVVAGTASATPSPPALDPTTQLYLTFVLVPATATSLADITNTPIYSEGSEWTATTSGTGFTANSTNNPYAGTKCIEGTTVAAGAYVKFVTGSPVSFDTDGNLILRIRSKAAWVSKRVLVLGWYRSGVAKGATVTLSSGAYGFDSSQTTSYQLIVIPKSSFQVPAGSTIDELRITDAGGSIGFYLDDIAIQNTGSTTVGGGSTSGLTQADADARYARRSLNLGDAASIIAAIDNLFTKGTDIASAATTNLAAATGNFVDVTGTTTITALGTLAAGVERTVRFTGILTLTHNATSLILPTAANITTAAGDVARFRSLGSGNWVCVAYQRASGQALASATGGGGGGAPLVPFPGAGLRFGAASSSHASPSMRVAPVYCAVATPTTGLMLPAVTPSAGLIAAPVIYDAGLATSVNAGSAAPSSMSLVASGAGVTISASNTTYSCPFSATFTPVVGNLYYVGFVFYGAVSSFSLAAVGSTSQCLFSNANFNPPPSTSPTLSQTSGNFVSWWTI